MNIAIFASGSGTNAENIIRYFQHHHTIKITAVLSDKPDAYVLIRAQNLDVPAFTFTSAEMKDENGLIKILQDLKIDFIVLAGFLRLIPLHIIQHYQNKIINIHPALLPKYGGKGMHGMFVHESVKASGDKETGITIHFVNEKYDEGKIIFQEKIDVDKSDTPETIAKKVHSLEYQYFPEVIENVVSGNLK